ncbi:MAG: hypothetical protein HKM89_02230, partial [Gemmatimonadales bacterium]|nr:hypothetical protein [Gemmatimonadales bacterium]
MTIQSPIFRDPIGPLARWISTLFLALLGGAIEPPPVVAQTSDTTRFKSGYEDVVVHGGATSVGADLVDDDLKKDPLFEVNFARQWLGGYYRLKRKLNDKLRLAVGVDYSLMNQFSNYSTTDTQAASGIFRVFGTWRVFGSRAASSGNLVYRIENRHLIGSGVTP